MLLTAADARRIISGKESLIGLILLIVVLATGLSFAVYLYTLDKYSLLYYGDAVSHLVRAREFVDSANPGIFEQLGTAWLPLPHLLLLPFTLIDSLFITGFAGLVISLPSLAITSVLIYKMIRTHLGGGISYIAIAGALLYASNPNILYIGMTAMTEAPFMLFFVASAYYFQRWTLGSPKYIHFQSEGGGEAKSLSTTYTLSGHGQASSSIRDLILCSVFLSLATLCRYESWILPILLLFFVVETEVKNKKQRYHYSSAYHIGIILISILSFSGIVFWLAWNTYEFGDPLQFLKAPFFSAASQALEGPNRESLYLQPLNVAAIYTLTALAMYGPALLAAAVLGYLFHRYFSGKKEEKSKRRNLYIFLALPPLFTVFSMIIGIGEINQRAWFNSRFLILICPLIILLACVFIARLPHKIRKNHLILIAIIGTLFAYQFATPEVGVVITFLDAKYQFFSANRPFQLKTAEALSSIYDGSSRILIITGSAQQNEIMQASGIPLKQFDPILESSSSKALFKKESLLYDKYFVISKKPDSSAKNVANYWLNRQDLLNKYFDVAYEDKYYKVMVLSKARSESSPVEKTKSSPTLIPLSSSEYPSAEKKDEKTLMMHIHTHLNVTVDGEPIIVPANIGIDPNLYKDHSLDEYGPQKSPLHTHTSSGTVHIESKIIANYTLGEFLNVWGINLDGKVAKLTVDGKPVPDYQNHILRDGQGINLILCKTFHSSSFNKC
jgi:4-amino-4-deoxy-L-arabinose transferase-like glycosyltransferase